MEQVWNVHIGIFAPVIFHPFQIIVAGSYTFTSSLPKEIKTSANQSGVNVILSSKFEGDKASEVAKKLDPILDELFNFLSFRLLKEVFPVALEIIEDKPESEKRDFAFTPKYSPLSRGRFNWLGFSSRGGLKNYESTHLDEEGRTAIRWFIQGMSAASPVEAFAAYWLSIESLLPVGSVAPLSMKCCNHEIASCPLCGKSTVGKTGQKKRAASFFKSIGKDREYFEKVWDIRNRIFHGSGSIFPIAMDIARISFELKAIAVALIKKVHQYQPINFPCRIKTDRSSQILDSLDILFRSLRKNLDLTIHKNLQKG